MPQAPEPKFNKETKELIKFYEDALKDIQAELNSLFLTDLQRAEILATEKRIREIIKETNEEVTKWSTAALTIAGLAGVAATLYALGRTKTYDKALSEAKFSRTNQRFLNAAIADTQADLLAVTQNVERQAKLAIRKATAESFRRTITRDNNATETISRDVRRSIINATDVAIIDRAGRRWKVGTYADMVAKTKLAEIHRDTSITSALEEGTIYGRISSHGAKDACSRWEGRIIKLTPDAPGNYPYYGDLPRREIFHPRCRHIVSAISRLEK